MVLLQSALGASILRPQTGCSMIIITNKGISFGQGRWKIRF